MRGFVFSTGRTGTHFITHYLTRHNLLPSLHQPQPDGYDVAWGYAKGLISAREAQDWLRERDFGEIVESNPYLFPLAGHIRELWPKARLVCILRDPVEVCRSGFKRQWYRPGVDYYYPEAHEFPGDPYAAHWKAMTRLERIAWYYRRLMLHLAGSMPRDALVLRFEDIFQPPYSSMRRLLDFFGVTAPFFPSTMAEVQSPSAKTAEDLAPEDIPTIHRIGLDWDWEGNDLVADSILGYLKRWDSRFPEPNPDTSERGNQECR